MGHGHKDDISKKSGNVGTRAWGGTEGVKRWQITRRGWGEGGGVAGHGYKDDISTKSGDLGRRAWGGTGGKSRGGARGDSP